MKSWFYLFLSFVLLLSSCHERKPVHQPTPVLKQTLPREQSAGIDTVFETQYLYSRKDQNDFQKDESVFRIGNDVYKAFTESYSLNDSSLVQIEPDSADGKLIGYKGVKCHNHVYSIRLTKNGKRVYERKFTKLDFLKLEDDGFIKESAPVAPTFRGVTADGRVLFDMWFCYPASDFGGISYFTTDLKGNLLKLESYSGTGGNGCSGVVEISSNGKYFLTCQKLYGPKEYVFAFGKPDMVNATFLTDTSFVALYDYVTYFYDKEKKTWDEKHDTKSNNLFIYHVNGKKIASYRFDGITRGLDYDPSIGVSKKQGMIFLMDEERKEVQTISISHPQSAKAWPLTSLKKLNRRVEETEMKEDSLYTMGTQYYFYFSSDTLKAYYVKEETS